jgi:hypothetical protein
LGLQGFVVVFLMMIEFQIITFWEERDRTPSLLQLATTSKKLGVFLNQIKQLDNHNRKHDLSGLSDSGWMEYRKDSSGIPLKNS